ncbi:MAG: FKBP-type peptidyl-prolyl cis-trans isomerase, partial [Anaerolineales bacterium]|nr:FKBP-type peptidyl-prolyl cis-trans isomerase [Anaerolineales bacterium]
DTPIEETPREEEPAVEEAQETSQTEMSAAATEPEEASSESVSEVDEPHAEAEADAVVPEEAPYTEDEAAGYQAEPRRGGSRTALIAFIVVLVLGIVLVAVFQFSRGLSTSSGISSLFVQSQTTESGLQFEELRTGTGEPVKLGDAVSVHYSGYLEDGTEFDSSLSRGQPFSFVVGYGFVIPGWDEGVQGMQAGGLRRLTIPPDLAYGEAGAGDLIPPNSTLVFEVELLDVFSTETEDLIVGDGAEVGAGDTITVEYTVWLMDGDQIDSSRDTGQPITFIVGAGQMLPGIEQGVVGMQLGGKRLVTIPPELAFGDQGLADLIPPGATLQFEFELVSIE